jgi:hypothetical protein
MSGIQQMANSMLVSDEFQGQLFLKSWCKLISYGSNFIYTETWRKCEALFT